ncbi:MAG: SIMPL domain-containing protein [Acidobacteria bacterium]|nr:SIMPL domain-containing protein [Acidobacteriota bacterium]
MTKSFLMLRACALVLILIFAAQASAAAKELTVRGRLAQTVEPGGWVINADAQKYLILNARKFQSESWFREGAEVEATGETKPDALTVYQEGVPFEARTIVARQGGGGAAAVTGGAADRDRNLTRVSVTGDAVVQSQPDTAIIMLAVVTQNASASEAQAENASKSDAVVRAVKAAAGANAEVKTGGYSLQPQYVYKEGTAPTITSYIVRNSVIVALSELGRVGGVIDAASRAGANSVDNLAFTLRRDQQARTQALSAATREAVAKARTIAEALGGRVVRVVEVQEAGAFRPPIPRAEREQLSFARAGAGAPSTPIEVGSLEVRAQVQLVAEIETKP